MTVIRSSDVINDPSLSRAADAVITDPSNDVFVSPATYWEIAIKVRKKKLDLFAPYDDFMQRGIQGNDFEILPIETKHTSLLTTMPFHHNDPFDRLLAAQVLVEQMPIVSVDSAFDAYGVNPTVVKRKRLHAEKLVVRGCLPIRPDAFSAAGPRIHHGCKTGKHRTAAYPWRWVRTATLLLVAIVGYGESRSVRYAAGSRLATRTHLGRP